MSTQSAYVIPAGSAPFRIGRPRLRQTSECALPRTQWGTGFCRKPYARSARLQGRDGRATRWSANVANEPGTVDASMASETIPAGPEPFPDSSEEDVAWDLKLASPAKINLFLRILRKREDGYHDLASLFQAISLLDDMFFKVLPEDATEDELECSVADIPTDGSNLVIKALNTFRARTGVRKFFRVRLDKRIPSQAGLGGGSGNAATALWAANKLSDSPATTEELAEFGAEFGSDVSFFFTLGTAYCTGRGEILEPLDRLLPETLWIVKPSEGLSTAEVFGKLDLSQTSSADPAALLKKMQTTLLIEADFVNDLEAPSFEIAPRLREIKDALEDAGFSRVLMSGSGTAFFCLGHPTFEEYGDNFAETFTKQYDVQIMRAMFVWRRHPDYWYVQEPSKEDIMEYLKHLKETRSSDEDDDAGEL